MAGLNDWIDINVKAKSCTIDFSDFHPMSKYDAIDHTINCITSKFDNLYLALSGGIDSEFVAKCLYERGVKFTPVIVDYALNTAEVWYAYYWCYKHNVVPDVITFKISEISEKFSQLALENDVPFITAIDFIIEHHVSKKEGHLISGSVEPFDRDFVFSDRLLKKTSDKLDFVSYDFTIDNIFPHKHPYSFNVYTPQMLFSLIRDLNYEKPIQIALCEYYGVSVRPKLPYIFNVAMDQKIMNDAIRINSKIQADSIIICDRHEFLEKALNKQKIHCSFERRNRVNDKTHNNLN